MQKISIYLLITVLSITVFMTGCSGNRLFIPPLPVPDDRNPVDKPAYRSAPNDFTDGFNQQFVLQGEQFTDLSRHIRNAKSAPKEAYNVDAFGEAPNSSWFTNRNAHKRLSIEEIIIGPGTGGGPDTSSVWTIIQAKAEGVTPGFTIIDSRGDKYVIKFDPIGYAGLNSGSEVIGSKLFYAAGYNVPENYITHFDPNILTLGAEVRFLDEMGRSRYMHEADLMEMLTRVDYLPSGLIRATASKYVPGKPLGPFRYRGMRKDDPNDFIPHQHRRELRGLRVMAAWLNHIDSKAANTMDTFIGNDGKGYVRHYLIDFGTILGSGGRGPQPTYRGYENELDPHAILLRTITLGLYTPKWERLPSEVKYPCIGRYYSDFYHPQKFKIIFPNPAYDNLTSQDGFWGAKLVMSFTDEQLRAVVAEAQYPDLEAAEYLLKTLIERRDKTGRYWFNRVNPLDDFRLIERPDDGSLWLRFTDLAVAAGLETEKSASYRYSIRVNGVKIESRHEVESSNHIPVKVLAVNQPAEFNNAQMEVMIEVKRDHQKKYGKWVKVYLEKTDQGLDIIGVTRQG